MPYGKALIDTVESSGNLAITGNVVTSGTITSSAGATYPLVSGTAQNTTSGTSIDFTGIPSWVKRLTVLFNNVSLSGTSSFLIQLGAGSVTTSGYSSRAVATGSAGNATGNSTNGILMIGTSASNSTWAAVTFHLITGNTWVATISGAISDGASNYAQTGGGSIALSGILDRVRITTVNGTDTFDAGSINILYE